MKNAARDKAIRVYVADSSETDARSFPGGNLIFYRGMFDSAENEAALVGVIGRELSHLDHGHQLYDAKRMKLLQSTFDDDGATWEYELGYDPCEMAKLFLRMHERDRAAKPGLPSFTHPHYLDRYEALTDRFKQLQEDKPKADLYIGTENLVRR